MCVGGAKHVAGLTVHLELEQYEEGRVPKDRRTRPVNPG